MKKLTSLERGSKQNDVTKIDQKSTDGQEQKETKVKENLLGAETSEMVNKVLESFKYSERLVKMKTDNNRELVWSVLVCLYICYILKQKYFGTYSSLLG